MASDNPSRFQVVQTGRPRRATRQHLRFTVLLNHLGIRVTLVLTNMRSDPAISALTARPDFPRAPLNTSLVIQSPGDIGQYTCFHINGEGSPVIIIAYCDHLPECKPIKMTPPQVRRLVAMAPVLHARAHGFLPMGKAGDLVLYVSPDEDDMVRYHMGAAPIDGVIYLVPKGDIAALKEAAAVQAGLELVRGGPIPYFVIELDDDDAPPESPLSVTPATIGALNAWLAGEHRGAQGGPSAFSGAEATPTATALLAQLEQRKHRYRSLEAVLKEVLEIADDKDRQAELLERFNELVQRTARTERYELVRDVTQVIDDLTERLRAGQITARSDRLCIDLAVACLLRTKLVEYRGELTRLTNQATALLQRVPIFELCRLGSSDALEFCWARAFYAQCTHDLKYMESTLDRIDELRNTAKDVDLAIRQQRQVECWRMYAEATGDHLQWKRVAALCDEIRITDPFYGWFGLAVALMRLDHTDYAKVALQELLRVSPADFWLALARDPKLSSLWADEPPDSQTTTPTHPKDNELSDPRDDKPHVPKEDDTSTLKDEEE